ncbi:MAG: arsenic metallochaperone ArsD family protein [Oxalobacter sp.]|nr:arsenic metallochaperone ArsD family protein [Oxalobacter sp.]
MTTLQIVEIPAKTETSEKMPEAVCRALMADGITVERLTPEQAALLFADKPTLLKKAALTDNLPLTIIDGNPVLAKRYPDRRELTEWLKLDVDVLNVPRCCCGSGRRCCWCGRYYLEGKNL